MQGWVTANKQFFKGGIRMLVLLPGFQKGRDIKAEGSEQFWPKKGNLRRTRKNLKNRPNFTPFRVNKMFSHKF
jgi:hypothetical protein